MKNLTFQYESLVSSCESFWLRLTVVKLSEIAHFSQTFNLKFFAEKWIWTNTKFSVTNQQFFQFPSVFATFFCLNYENFTLFHNSTAAFWEISEKHVTVVNKHIKITHCHLFMRWKGRLKQQTHKNLMKFVTFFGVIKLLVMTWIMLARSRECERNFNVRRVGNDEAAEKGKSWAKTSPETNFIDPIFISLQLVVSHFPSSIHLPTPPRYNASSSSRKSIVTTTWNGRRNFHWLRSFHIVSKHFPLSRYEREFSKCFMYEARKWRWCTRN